MPIITILHLRAMVICYKKHDQQNGLHISVATCTLTCTNPCVSCSFSATILID